MEQIIEVVFGFSSTIFTWVVTFGMYKQGAKNRANPEGISQIPKLLYVGVSGMHSSNLALGCIRGNEYLVAGTFISSAVALYVLYQLLYYPKKFNLKKADS